MKEKVKNRTIQLDHANEKLRELSLHDPLTNIHNRRFTVEVISDTTTKFINAQARLFSSEIKIEKLLTTLIRTIIENAGAQCGCLLLKNENDNELYIEASQCLNSGKVRVMQSLPFKESKELCPEVVQYVARTRSNLVIHDACAEGDFQTNPYIVENRIKSVLCMPVLYQNIIMQMLTIQPWQI